MKSIPSILLIIAITFYGPYALADSESKTVDKEPFSWSRFWQEFKNDWIKVGHEAKDAGTEAGHTIKKEVQELPGNVREGFSKAKEDFKNAVNSSDDAPSEP